jgi:DNA polymerase (family 10)
LRDKQTERIIRAMDNPYFNILAHPSGRLLGEREAYAIDLERIMASALERGCFLEVNAQPQRLDLAGPKCHMAREMGLKVAVSTDSHSTAQLANMRLGVAQARRGWLEAANVLNTRTWPQLRRLLRRA